MYVIIVHSFARSNRVRLVGAMIEGGVRRGVTQFPVLLLNECSLACVRRGLDVPTYTIQVTCTFPK